MSSKYQAYIFDFDGVLVDSEPVHARAWQILLEQRGIKITLEDLYDGIGISSPVFVIQLEKKYNFTFTEGHRAIIDQKRTLYENLALTEMQPVAGVPALLNALEGKITLAICTASVMRSVGQIVHHFGWEKYFTTIVTFDQVLKAKPDPALYLETLRRLDLPPEAALVFEDSPVGVQAARAAQLDVAGIATYFSRQQLLDAGAFDTFANFADPNLQRWLDPALVRQP